MDRYVSAALTASALLLCAVATSCSSGSSTTHVVSNQVPAAVSLTPSPNVSLELGKTQIFTASAANSVGTALTETFTYQSSAPGVVTVAANGLACAGTWDSLTAPTLCTPGNTGVAQVIVVANGVSSPPVTVYVHQRVTSVVVQKVPNQPPTLSATCLSRGAPGGPEHVQYQAFAFAGNSDITSSVGPFSFGTTSIAGQPAGFASALLSSFGNNPQLFNRATATANVPGIDFIFASAGGVNSQPVSFVTCPVQSISLSVQSTPVTSIPFVLGAGGSLTVNATATDTANMVVTGIPLTWSSSNQPSVSVSAAGSAGFASVGTVTASTLGTAAVTASCTPPSCNGGISPSLPIYPTQPANVVVSANSQSSTSSSAPTVYATTTGCSSTTQICTTRIVPITRSGSTTSFALGTPVNLPATPNSFVFGPTASSAAYLGVANQALGTQGLMIFNGSAVTQFTGAAGRILAVSPSSATVILSDATDSPSRVIICQDCNTTNRTMTSILFPNPAAAAFSPEGIVGSFAAFKAYVVSGSSCPGTASPGCLLVYSTVDSTKMVSLSAPATDAAFIGDGAAGFIAGGDPAGMSYLATCNVPPSSPGALPAVPASAQSLRTLPDGLSVIALAPPFAQTVSTTLGGTGCPSPRGSFTITPSVGPLINLGQGAFSPRQVFLSPDSSVLYVLADASAGGGPLPFIIAYHLNTTATSLISLVGNATPLSAGTSSAGDLLFVGANDNQVHVIDTSTGLDATQVSLPFPQASLCVGPGNPATQPSISSIVISAATQTGPTTTYTYSLANGAPLQVGETVTIAAMNDAGNNGTFTISALNSGTFSVANGAGVTATGQNGSGIVPVTCNPDLIAVKP